MRELIPISPQFSIPERERGVATAMHLFQLFTTARSKLDTNPPTPESDYVELVWENGQILAQGQSQSNRARRSGFHPSVSLPSNGSEAETRKKAGQLREPDFCLGELSAPLSGEIGLGQDEDVVPWLNYPFNGSLHSDDFCSDLLPELPRIARVADGGQPQVCKNSDSMRFLENSMRGEVTVARAGPTQPSHLNPSSSEPQQQSRFSSRFLEDVGKVKAMTTEDQGRADQGSALSSFPCFSRTATLFGLDTDDPKASVIDRADQVDLNFAGSSGVMQSVNKQDAGTVIVGVSDVLHDRNEAENGKFGGRTVCGATEAGGIAAEGEKNMDHWDSSVCSGNTVERDACYSKLWLKRKSRDNDELDAPSESMQRGRSEQLQDVDEELVREKKQVPSSSRGTASKRNRVAEVHNLSERRRRDRINEKMCTLQELIPNCNKADKASMLDDAIKYLKMLQLQVQMMTMGAGLYMPPMMLPTGIHNMPPPNMPHFPHMGLGMGPGIGYGGMGLNAGNSVTHRPMVHIPPPVHGGHFPTMHHGMLPGAFGYPGQGIPMFMPRTPFHPLCATSMVTSVTSGYGMALTTAVSSSKETGPRITTPTSTNFSCPGDQPPPQSGQIQSSRETSDANAMDSGGPTITCNGK